MLRKSLIFALLVTSLLFADTPKPPVAAKKDHVVTSPNGDRNDPYYWMRDDKRQAPEVLAHLNAENAYYQAMSAPYAALADKLYEEIVGRIKQDDSSVPYKKGSFRYGTRFETGKEYPLYFRVPVAGGDEQIMIDANVEGAGKGYYQVANTSVSPNEQLLAYCEDTVGRRQYTLRFRDLRSGKNLPDTIPGLSASLAWAADNKTIYYIENDPTTLLSTRVKKHVLGTDPKTDPTIYEEQDKSYYMGLGKTTDDRYILIALSATVSDEVRVLPADASDNKWQVLAPRQRDFKYRADHNQGRWVINTDWNAPNYRLMSVADGQIGDRAKWQELLPHDPKVLLRDFALFDNYLAISERSNGLQRLRVLPLQNPQGAYYVEGSESCYVAGLSVNEETNTEVLRYAYTSLTTPSSVFELNMRTGEKQLLKEDPVLGGFDKSRYETTRVWATARDGSKIPVSLLYKKGTPKDGSTPLYQYGYGSYGSSMDPYFRQSALSLVDRGLIFAIAHIRGGQEMGRDWYENGKLLHKIHTFSDFIDVTDYLVKEKWAAKDKVFAQGGSAGGLLMGAVANMAPDRYRGIIANVPFVDVVTTMLDESIPLTTNEFDEWGNPKEKKYYDYMLSYSPYDQVKKQAYPAMLVTTGLHDSQVGYFEPAKWVARLREMKTDDQVLLFKINMEAGHGGKSGRFQRLKEVAAEYAFILNQLGQSN